jgi:hypothetical protein
VNLKKLNWRQQRLLPMNMQRCGGAIWKDLPRVEVPKETFTHLFQQREKESSKKMDAHVEKSKTVVVLDQRRANNILIEIKRFPAARHIKTAVLSMDHAYFTREMVEKLLTKLMPTDEERTQITEARASQPDVPLGPAEEFLYTLTTIPELKARLSLWRFNFQFQQAEEELGDALMEVKRAIEEVYHSKTLKRVLGTLLSIGNFLNGTQSEAFNLEYLSRVPDVKDTVHRAPLLLHVVELMVQQFPDGTDLFSEISHVHRVSKMDWGEQTSGLEKLQTDLAQSWEYLRAVAKHETSADATSMEKKMKCAQSLTEAAQKLKVLQVVYRRVLNRYNKLCLYMGMNSSQVESTRVDAFCLLLSNFALEYRTTFGKVVAKNERKKQERDRNKTKGKFINKVKDVAGKGDKKSSSRKQGTEETDTAESDLVAQLANAVVKDDKRRVKDGVKARRKGGKAKKKIIRRTIGRPEELAEIESVLEAQGR